MPLTPEDLNPLEADSWVSYCQQRRAEIKEAYPNVEDSRARQLAWVEFLCHRWVFRAKIPFSDVSPLNYALKVHEHGPDLGALPFTLNPRPRPRRQRLDSGPVYAWFAKKRLEEMKESNEENHPIRVLIEKIAEEWREMGTEARTAIAMEAKTDGNQSE
jgi:hypothetical protein